MTTAQTADPDELALIRAGFPAFAAWRKTRDHDTRPLCPRPARQAPANSRDPRSRAVVSRWRKAGYAATGRLGPGPGWCWLTRSGLAVTGLGFPATPPSLGRLAHLRAVLAVRLSMEAGDAWEAGQAHWRSERRLRAAMAGKVPSGHVPDGEVTWGTCPAARTRGSGGPSRPS